MPYQHAHPERLFHEPRTNEDIYQSGLRVPAQPRTMPRLTSGAQSARQSGTHRSYPNPQSRLNSYRHDYARGLPSGQQGAPADISGIMSGLTFHPTLRSTTYQNDGIQMVETTNPQSQVRTRIGIAPANQITDPALFSSGISAVRMICGAGEDDNVERLYSNYRVRRPEFFIFGRVFMVLWADSSEHAGGSIVTNLEASDRFPATSAFNERVYSKVRRFIIIREGRNYCSALPIVTYSGRGVGKEHVIKSDHAIIYTGRTAPTPGLLELPSRGEAGMRPIPIRVVPDEPTEALDPMSRLDFGKVHTVKHNIKVRSFGDLHPDSKESLARQFMSVWNTALTPGEYILSDHRDSVTGSTSEQATHRDNWKDSSSRPIPTQGRRLSTDVLQAARLAIRSSKKNGEPEQDSDDEEQDDDDQEALNNVARSHRFEQISSVRTQHRYSEQQYGRPNSTMSSISTSTTTPFPASAVPSAQPRTTPTGPNHIQSSWNDKVRLTRAAFNSLRDRGYSNEQAFTMLVHLHKQQHSSSALDSDSEIRVLLTGTR